MFIIPLFPHNCNHFNILASAYLLNTLQFKCKSNMYGRWTPWASPCGCHRGRSSMAWRRCLSGFAVYHMTSGETSFLREVLFLDYKGLVSESRDPAHYSSLISLHLRLQEEVTGISFCCVPVLLKVTLFPQIQNPVWTDGSIWADVEGM